MNEIFVAFLRTHPVLLLWHCRHKPYFVFGLLSLFTMKLVVYLTPSPEERDLNKKMLIVKKIGAVCTYGTTERARYCRRGI